jgi:hypothetical protein
MNDQQAKRKADTAQAHRNELTNSLALIVSLSLPFVRSPRAANKFFWAAIALQYDPIHSLLGTIELT